MDKCSSGDTYVIRRSPARLTEAKAQDRPRDQVGRFPLPAMQAIALGEPEGMVQTIFDAKNSQLIGAHIRARGDRLISFCHCHGSETTEKTEHTVPARPCPRWHESVLDAYGRAIPL